MPLKLSDLPQYLGRTIVVQEDLIGFADVDDDFREHEGKVVRADERGLVLETRHGTVIIDASRILDCDVTLRSSVRRLMRRWLRDATPAIVRQHLLDRHGMPYDLVSAKAMDNEAFFEMHQRIDHSGLGHQHGEKPQRGIRNTEEQEVLDVEGDE